MAASRPRAAGHTASWTHGDVGRGRLPHRELGPSYLDTRELLWDGAKKEEEVAALS